MKNTLVLLLIVSATCALIAFYYATDNALVYKSLESARQTITQTKEELAHWQMDSTARIERAKDKLVESLAKECETKTEHMKQLGVKNPEKYVTYDYSPDAAKPNNPFDYLSMGEYQFKVGTVKAYVKKFEGREIEDWEAVKIATTHKDAHELAKRIIFEDEGKGVGHWKNCSRILNLEQQVKLIKSL